MLGSAQFTVIELQASPQTLLEGFRHAYRAYRSTAETARAGTRPASRRRCPTPKPQWIPPISCVPDRQSTAEPNLLYRVNMARAKHPKKGRRGRAGKGGSGRMDSYAHIIGTSMGCDAVRGSAANGLPGVNLVHAPQSRQSREAIAWRGAQMSAWKRAFGGSLSA